jgi:DNA repair exonuclease SbcCD ATPase subunit
VQIQQRTKEIDLLSQDRCPTCGQSTEGLQGKKQELEEEQAVAEKKHGNVKRQLEKLKREKQGGREDLDQMADEIAELRRNLSAQERIGVLREEIEIEMKEAEEDLARQDKRVSILSEDVMVLEMAERVLGLRGVRAHVLGKALSGIEGVANAHLAQMADEVAVRLRPYSENKSGGVSDAISLDVEGYGAGLGYKACSTGQQRRINTAILLALSEVSDAAFGQEPGALFFDEALDGLDESGVSAAGDVLAEMATERQVFVVSHNPVLIEQLSRRAKQRIEVSDGRLSLS